MDVATNDSGDVSAYSPAMVSPAVPAESPHRAVAPAWHTIIVLALLLSVSLAGASSGILVTGSGDRAQWRTGEGALQMKTVSNAREQVT